MNKRFVLYPLIVICVLIFFGYQSMDIIEYVTNDLQLDIITIGIFDAYLAQLSISTILTLVCLLPIFAIIMFFEICSALYEHECNAFRYSILPATWLFSFGFILSFFYIIPSMISYIPITDISQTVSLDSYINIVLSLSLAFGIIFVLPILIITLVMHGLIRISLLERIRKHVYIMALVIGALLTPPDIFTQVLLAVPLIILYELSIIISKVLYRIK